ncbi:hypothetical protein BD779DRAFT_1678661 [Infundibulicybe gibba]|nr:hypothetical protein BD779DRAFT_1678661 [Infundibulicybe gibba]
MPPKHTPSSKSAGKRRKRVSSDDDDVEIVEPPPVEDGESPSRSIRRKLPAGSVIDAIDTMIHGQAETSPLSTRSSRVRVKTEKGRLLSAMPLKTQRQTKKVVVPSPVISESDSDLPELPTITTKKPRISGDISNGGDAIAPNSGHESNPTSLSGKIIAALKVTNTGSPGSTDEDTNNTGFRGPVSPASSDVGGKEPADDLDDGVQSPGSESEEQSETVSDIVEKNTSAAWDGPSTMETASEIMDFGLQHPDLRVLYEHLPHLPSFCDIRVWNYPRGPEMLERVDFEQLKPVLSAR